MFLNKNYLSIFLLLLFLSAKSQTSINKPLLAFTEVCATGSLNFSLNFGFSSTSVFLAANVFTVQLSDSNGSFTNPTILTTTTMSSSPVMVQFIFPSNLQTGLNYRIRIKSSAPVSTSPSSDPFPATFKPFDQSFTINNGIQNQSFCQNSFYTINIDAGGPLNFNQLNYIWYRNNTVIPNENGSTISVNQPGNYYTKVNYGDCPSNANSNIVTLTQANAQVLNINAANNQTIICNAPGIMLSSTLIQNGFVYEWYRNEVLIPNSNASTYTASQAGTYFLKIANNTCVTPSNQIVLTSQEFNVGLTSLTSILIPGQTASLNCITNAINPSFKWYKNSVLIDNQNLINLTINEAAAYKVIVRQNSVCISDKEASIQIQNPSIYNLQIEHKNSYTACLSTTTNLGILNFTANGATSVLNSGVTISYQWFKNTNPVLGAISNTISIANYLYNGDYFLRATMQNGQLINSNIISVQLKSNLQVVLPEQVYLCASNPVAEIIPNIQNNQYTYKWYATGNTNVLSNSLTYATSTENEYYLSITDTSGCELISNTIKISRVTSSLLVTNYDTMIELDEGETITITASGADSYNWSVANQPDVTTSTFTTNQTGTILLTGKFGTCFAEKNFTISVSRKIYNKIIPNAITPNSDGANDTWIIPERFAYQEDVEIVIFRSNQEILFRSKNYLNDWPAKDIKEDAVYYYKIIRGNNELEKGTISVIH